MGSSEGAINMNAEVGLAGRSHIRVSARRWVGGHCIDLVSSPSFLCAVDFLRS